MAMADEVFPNCDELEKLPRLNRENYEFETEYLTRELPRGSSLLQVGSMDGTRAARILEARPDLRYTGLDIEAGLVAIARRIAPSATFVIGDITNPPHLDRFDVVFCLNHTLGYIPDVTAAIANMRELGARVILSVYGERFDEVAAADYFDVLGLEIGGVSDTEFDMASGWVIRRFTRADVDGWGGSVMETPLGYLVELS